MVFVFIGVAAAVFLGPLKSDCGSGIIGLVGRTVFKINRFIPQGIKVIGGGICIPERPLVFHGVDGACHNLIDIAGEDARKSQCLGFFSFAQCQRLPCLSRRVINTQDIAC
ncbi:MAG: hypothetical protein A4E71_01290 [Smithella sp. PtaU1.Bin162]|nr:MAG: hypothetical protein A4E71_01290 [Smithella sp. PtaU1.Bin162]